MSVQQKNQTRVDSVIPFSARQFQKDILDWFKILGRKDLPWQQKKSPYHVWLSEIMLQQTQVVTVIPYFQRFIQRFPSFSSLAKAELDEVLSLWSGLGYYARGRNLHRCAQIVIAEHGGELPQNLTALQNLPGIGRSTAGAILALGFNKCAAILDGNVIRVLTRFQGIREWPRSSHINKQLWSLAEYYTPTQQVADYTQAMMDLGALICTRSQPRCKECPLQTHCLAYRSGRPEDFPSVKPSKKIPSRSIKMLILVNTKQHILLEKRSPTGIWGGLWSLPECPYHEDAQQFSKKYYHCDTHPPLLYPSLKHTFSHFHLEITPLLMQVKKWYPPLMESRNIAWYNKQQLAEKGLAAPVKKLLKRFI